MKNSGEIFILPILRAKKIAPTISSLAITNTTSLRIPRMLLHAAFYILYKKHIMDISLVFLPEKEMRRLNNHYRKKNKATNVLAFPLSKYEGEVCIDPVLARKEAKYYGISFRERVAYLFIHGLLHLQGYDHANLEDAKIMESREKTVLRQIL